MPRWIALAAALLVAAAPRIRAQNDGSELSLAEAVRRAEATSESVLAASARLSRSDAELRRARAERLPQLWGSVSYTRTLASQFQGLRGGEQGAPGGVVRPRDCAPFVPDPGLEVSERIDALGRILECVATATPDLGGSFEDLPFGRENQYLLGLSFSQAVYAGGGIEASIRAAREGRSAAEVELASARAALALDVVEAYFDAQLSARVVEIAEATLEQARATFQQTEVAYRVGAQAEFDMLRAAVVSENQEPVVIEARADRDIAELRLKQLLDVTEPERLRLTTSLGDESLPPLWQLASLPAGGERAMEEVEVPDELGRAPVRQALAAVRLRRAQLDVASAARLPRLTLSSSYGLIRFPETVLPTSGQFLNDWTVTLGAEMPLFTGGRLQAEEELARASLEEARAEAERTEELAALDTADALERLEAAEARLQASAGTVATAIRAYEIAEVRYREGISTQLELTDTRLQLQQAEVNRARAARDLRVASARVLLLPYLPIEGGAFAPPASTSPGVTPSPSPSIPATSDPARPTTIAGSRSQRERR